MSKDHDDRMPPPEVGDPCERCFDLHNALAAYLEGTALPGERKDVQAHMSECAYFRWEVEMHQTDRVLREVLGISDDDPPAMEGSLWWHWSYRLAFVIIALLALLALAFFKWIARGG